MIISEQVLYDQIPKSSCKSGCFACCTNSVQFTPQEEKNMGGYAYNGQCSHLLNGKCTIYDRRPFVCRIYGTSELLKCEHCIPEKYLTEEETNDLVHRYIDIKKQQEQ